MQTLINAGFVSTNQMSTSVNEQFILSNKTANIQFPLVI